MGHTLQINLTLIVMRMNGFTDPEDYKQFEKELNQLGTEMICVMRQEEIKNGL
jgi:hypothetical protein